MYTEDEPLESLVKQQDENNNKRKERGYIKNVRKEKELQSACKRSGKISQKQNIFKLKYRGSQLQLTTININKF